MVSAAMNPTANSNQQLVNEHCCAVCTQQVELACSKLVLHQVFLYKQKSLYSQPPLRCTPQSLNLQGQRYLFLAKYWIQVCLDAINYSIIHRPFQHPAVHCLQYTSMREIFMIGKWHQSLQRKEGVWNFFVRPFIVVFIQQFHKGLLVVQK